ncbi:FtsW/RodA/SpoVE family cell cycle protein [Enterococcus olivae]
MPNKKIKKRQFLDLGILVPYLILSVVGLMMVYSTTAYIMFSDGRSFEYQVVRQFAFWILSLILMVVIYKMKIDFLRNKKLVQIAMVVITILLLTVFLFDKEDTNGAYGWIQLPGIGSIQPVEFLKFIVIWFLSVNLTRRQQLIQDNFWTSVKGLLIVIACQVGIVTIYPDLGNAAVIVLLVMVVLLTSGVNYLYTFFTGAVAIVGSILAIFAVNSVGRLFLPSHVLTRFSTFRNPFIDEFGDGHQLIHGYYAMFNGGLFGRGLGNSIQKKGFLKFAHTDFAFSIVVEELGLIVAIIILGLLFYMIARIILIGIRSNDAFNSMMCIGIGALFLISVFINLGGITGVIPLTGITFPFISQGGSSLLMFSICIGFVLNISADEKKKAYQLNY